MMPNACESLITRPAMQSRSLRLDAESTESRSFRIWIVGYWDTSSLHQPRSSESATYGASRERHQVQDRVITLFAGAEAEARFRGLDPGQVVAEGGPHEDYLLVELFGEDLEPSLKPRAALFEYLEARASDIVEIHWYLVGALATRLAERGVLSGVAVHRILRETIVLQEEADDFGASLDLTPLGFRDVADLIGRAKRGYDED